MNKLGVGFLNALVFGLRGRCKCGREFETDGYWRQGECRRCKEERVYAWRRGRKS